MKQGEVYWDFLREALQVSQKVIVRDNLPQSTLEDGTTIYIEATDNISTTPGVVIPDNSTERSLSEAG